MLRTDQYPDANLNWPIPYTTGVLPLAKMEYLRLVAYKCDAGRWTIGYGDTENVYPGQRITKPQAEQMLVNSLTQRVSRVRAMCTVAPTANQLCALVHLEYNIGEGALRTSTVLRNHNKGKTAAAARAFELFNKFRDPQTKQLVESEALLLRRKHEAALYLTPDDEDHHQMIPQAVAAESSLAASPISQSSVATAATGALTLASTMSDQASGVVDKLKEFADLFGLQPSVLIGGALLVFAGVTLYQRWKQRDGGWA